MKTTLWFLLFVAGLFCLPSARAQMLTCSPAPCVTSNVQFTPSTTSYTAAGFSLAGDYAMQTAAIFGIEANLWNGMSYCDSAGTSETAGYTTHNQGRSWNGGCQSATGDATSLYQDPITSYDINGTFYAGSLAGASSGNNGVMLHALLGGSMTWGNYFNTIDFTDQSTDNFYLFDFPNMFIDNKQVNPRIYVTAFEEGTDINTGNLVTAVVVGVSSNGGSTWTTQRVSSILSYPALALYPRVTTGPDSTVYVTWVEMSSIRSTTGTVYSAYSTNLGLSYSTPASGFTITNKAKVSCSTILPQNWQVPNTCVRMFYYPNITATQVGSTQTLFAVYPDYSGGQVSTELRYSTNKGVTWSGGTFLAAKTGSDQFEPNIAADPVNSGTIGVAWLDTRNSPNGHPGTLFDTYGMVSANGGSTWSPLARFSSASGNPSVTPVSNAAYLGDWIGVTFLNGYFWVAFPSTANGSHQVGMFAGFNP